MAALVAGTGCAQIFGLDNTTGVDAPSGDVASIQVQRVSIGSSVIKSPQDMSMQTAQFLQDDGAGGYASVPGELSGVDTLSARVTGTPPVLFTVPDEDVPTRMYALPARAQLASLFAFEHPNPQEPLPSSKLMLSVTLPTPYVTGQTFRVESIGAWVRRSLVAAELPLPDMSLSTISTQLDYNATAAPMFTPIAGGERVRIIASDVTLLLRYTGQELTGVLQAQFDQTDGTDTMAGTMTAVTADKTAVGMIDPPALSARFAAVRPAVGAAAMTWRVTAAPGWQYASETGVRLNTASPAPAATDTMFTATFGNPFESLDWRSLLTFATSASRSYAYTENAMTANVTLSAAMSMSVEPGTDPTTFDLPSGLPITITANQTALVTDGQPLQIDPTKPVEIDATLDRPTNTVYSLALVELGLDTTGASPVVTRKTIVDVSSTTTVFKIPSNLFTVGKSYYLTYRSTQGFYPGAADGDLQTTMLPRAAASFDSAVFTVEMP